MTTADGFDPVLAAAPPAIDLQEAVRIARSTFGVDAAEGAHDLGSERDRAFRLVAADGRSLAVMKVSNTAESTTTLDMEALAVLHVRRVDPGLPVAIPRTVPGAPADADDPACYRAAIDLEDGRHHVRLYDVLPGRARPDARGLPDAAFTAWGETTARLDRALRGFAHPAAQRTMLWDVQHALRTRSMVPAIRDAQHRDLVGRVLDRYEAVVAPVWPGLRAQVVHGDLTTDNTLLDDDGRITGIVDFGDMSHSALVTELASVLDSLLDDRPADDLFRLTRLVLDGFQRLTPLEPVELRIVGEVLAARAAVTIAISSWRSAQGLEDPAFAERYNAAVAQTMRVLLETGWDDVARRLGADVPPPPSARAELIRRRAATMGPALEPLTYETPIQAVEARGVWITDADGRRYLDAYNNVPCVGHGHPRVTEAIARQSRRLNTNLRYLHESAIELAERLLATCPPGIDTAFYVNSGSEANDLAWRLATTATARRGGLCTAHAYHGISDAIAPLSPETWPAGRQPEHVATWDPTGGADAVADALDRLAARGNPAAAVILDGVLTSDGYPSVAPADARAWWAAARDRGAVWIADEVQGGHGRTGESMWSFERLGIEPDIVTLGKPMGNGHPVGAVLTRRDLAEAFAAETVFFSTFGGNPVSMAASHAVLDVLADERIPERTQRAGTALLAALRQATAGDPSIREVRGAGLAIGVECVSRDVATALKEGLRDRGVLVGTAGRDGSVLKIRPPLAFTEREASIVADALADSLSARRP